MYFTETNLIALPDNIYDIKRVCMTVYDAKYMYLNKSLTVYKLH